MVRGFYVLNIWGIYVDQWYGERLLCVLNIWGIYVDQ